MKTLFYPFLVLSLIFGGCGIQKNSSIKDGNLNERSVSDIKYQVLKSGDYRCDNGEYLDENGSFKFFRSDRAEDVKKFNKEYALYCEDKISFEGTVMISTMGVKSSGGYSYEIKQIRDKNESIEITLKTKSPEKGSIVTTALTNPYIIILFVGVYKNVTLIKE